MYAGSDSFAEIYQKIQESITVNNLEVIFDLAYDVTEDFNQRNSSAIDYSDFESSLERVQDINLLKIRVIPGSVSTGI
jgi:hypothetical protein